MSKRKAYTVLAIVIVMGVFGYECFLNQKEQEIQIEQGKTIKEYTNTYYLPSSTTGQVIHHQGYSLSYNEPYEQAEWVAYELKKNQLSDTHYARPYFEIDKAVTTGAASWRNYKNSGYDRGHLCPAGDRNYSKVLFDETFLTSNISPQEHNFNSGIWNALEHKVREWALLYDGVFVVTGGVLTRGLKTIGKEHVAVPKLFYKIVLDNHQGHLKMIAFLMPHQNSNAPLRQFVVPVDSVEKLTGIDFFPQLDDAVETALEASKNDGLWDF